ncbi:hypothetical protein NDU88_006386 [Pleurodeles waltl]|uniref:Uncharacterized protein n=1 Tax=Pleurodeles waltl TaxID=8319 RepID=A0AAV7RLS4_PLEWA|nr:hypothetical protein NDU88_006386 [Pleurodeles waltl]
MCRSSGGWSLRMAIQELTRWRRVAKSMKEATFRSQVLQMNADQEVTEFPAEISMGPVPRIRDLHEGCSREGEVKGTTCCPTLNPAIVLRDFMCLKEK